MFPVHAPFFYSEKSVFLFFFAPTQPSNTDRVPWCFYPQDYGYTATATNSSASGITVDITRNKKYRSSGRPGSPDIDTLRVEIRYHSSDMLQFKVCIYLFSLSCISLFVLLGIFPCASCFHLFFLSSLQACCLPDSHSLTH